jgi:hypothetical protein
MTAEEFGKNRKTKELVFTPDVEYSVPEVEEQLLLMGVLNALGDETEAFLKENFNWLQGLKPGAKVIWRNDDGYHVPESNDSWVSETVSTSKFFRYKN